MRVQLSKYNKEWEQDFLKLKSMLKEAINENISIKHIGSTAVEELIAKPIIDILIGVFQNDLDRYIKSIENLGFEYINKYEEEIPFRRFFIKKNKVHIHVVKRDSFWFKRHIAFRDSLRRNKKFRESYEKLKIELARRDWKDLNDYSDAKTNFIRSIEKKVLNES